MVDVFREKDRLLEDFKVKGHFPGKPGSLPATPVLKAAFTGCMYGVTATLMAVILLSVFRILARGISLLAFLLALTVLLVPQLISWGYGQNHTSLPCCLL